MGRLNWQRIIAGWTRRFAETVFNGNTRFLGNEAMFMLLRR
jgi:hypothetical protein